MSQHLAGLVWADEADLRRSINARSTTPRV
jgi:hypothetical protein